MVPWEIGLKRETARQIGASTVAGWFGVESRQYQSTAARRQSHRGERCASYVLPALPADTKSRRQCIAQ